MADYDSEVTVKRTYVRSAVASVTPTDSRYQLIRTDESIVDKFNGVNVNDSKQPIGARVKSVTISGMKLVVESGSLLDAYNGEKDLQTLEIVADEVVIRKQWKLPGTDVTISARRLSFEGNGQIVTTPEPPVKPSADSSTGTGNGADGDPGQRAGNVTLYVGAIDISATGVILDLTGGAAQNPGAGMAGENGADGEAMSASTKVQYRPKVQVEDTATFAAGDGSGGGIGTGTVFHWERSSNFESRTLQDACHSESEVSIDCQNILFVVALLRHGPAGLQTLPAVLKSLLAPLLTSPTEVSALRIYGSQDNSLLLIDCDHTPTSGHAPKFRAGTPGLGGQGGDLYTQVDIAPSHIRKGGGPSGKSLPTEGGSKGKFLPGNTVPSKLARLEMHFWRIGGFIPSTGSGNVSLTPLPVPVDSPTVAGRDVQAAGDAGIYQRLLRSWLNPLHFQTVLHFVDDAYLAGDTDLASTYLRYYLGAIDQALAFGWPDLGPLAPTFQTARAELFCRIHRIESHLDFFGNPAGWAPMFSLVSSLKIFDKEVESALRALFLAEWFDENREKSVAASRSFDQALSDIQSRRPVLKQQLADLNDRVIPTVVASQQAVAAALRVATGKLSDAETSLRKKAQGIVANRRILNTLLHIGSALCSLIPEGQPVLGMIGGGLDQLADYDSTKDPDLKQAGSQLATFLASFGELALESKAKSMVDSMEPVPAGKKDAATANKEMAATMSGVASKLVPFADKLSKQLTQLKVPKDEIEAQLQTLEAADAEFKEFADAVRDLNEKKETFAQELTATQHAISDLSGQICQGLLTEDALYADRLKELNKFNPLTCLYIRNLGGVARQRLLRYQYYMVKAYEYEKLAPGPSVDYTMVDVVKELRKVVDIKTAFLTDPQIKTLKSVVNQTHDAIIDKLRDDLANASSEQHTIPLKIDGDRIRTLNDFHLDSGDRHVILNPMEMRKILPDWQDVRVKNITITRVVPKQGSTPLTGTLYLSVNYRGQGTIRKGRNLYAIRQIQDGITEGDSAVSMAWTADLKPDDLKPGGALTNHTPGEADLESFKLLLDDKSLTDVFSMMYRPPAWSNLELRADCPDQNIPLESIELDIDVVIHKADTNDKVLVVREALNRSVDLTIKVNGKPHAARTLAYEVYPKGTAIEVFGDSLGDEGIVAWEVTNGQSFKAPSAQVVLNDNRELTCQFGQSKFPLAPRYAPTCYYWADKQSYYPHKDANGVITSKNWVPGFRVRYAFSFADSAGESARGPWTRWLTQSGFIHASLQDLPWDPTGKAAERRIYRQFQDEAAPVELVGKIMDNDPKNASWIDRVP